MATTMKNKHLKKRKRKSEHFISLREISDDRTSISSTRWAFASVIKFDIIVIFLMVVSGLLSHFIPTIDDLSGSFYGSVTALLGVLTGLVSTTKAMQGFETKKDKNEESIENDNEDVVDNEEELIDDDDNNIEEYIEGDEGK
jgi:hypothetical protein